MIKIKIQNFPKQFNISKISKNYKIVITWNIDLTAYLLIINGGGVKIPWGFNLPYRGGAVFNKEVQYTMDENWPRGQFTMGFKIPYDTGIIVLSMLSFTFARVCGLFEWKRICAAFLLFVYKCAAVWDPVIIIWFNPATFSCLSQARAWNSNIIQYVMVFLCSVSSVRMRGDSLFCWLALILIHWTQQKRPWHKA